MNVKERLIRMIQSSPKPPHYRNLIQSFDKSRRAQAIVELSFLLSAGYIHMLGTGRRGQPHRVVISGTWPFNKCPMCGQKCHESILRDTPAPEVAS
jgi:hypothetical protein